MANLNTPIPQNPIGENFVWREWFQKLSNRVYGSLGTQESNNVSITGGAIDNTPIGAATPSSGHFTSVQLNSPLAVLYGGTAANTASGARTNLGVTATGADTTYAYRANNLSDLASASTARTNLGLGTAATHAATDFDASGAAAAAQAASLQISSNLSDLASASTARTNLGLGTMATQNTGISATVTLAKLTLTGANGSLTVSNGIITAYTAPT